jgi:hypothetical protein
MIVIECDKLYLGYIIHWFLCYTTLRQISLYDIIGFNIYYPSTR